jgi:hypothetical protein
VATNSPAPTGSWIRFKAAATPDSRFSCSSPGGSLGRPAGICTDGQRAHPQPLPRLAPGLHRATTLRHGYEQGHHKQGPA